MPKLRRAWNWIAGRFHRRSPVQAQLTRLQKDAGRLINGTRKIQGDARAGLRDTKRAQKALDELAGSIAKRPKGKGKPP